MQGRGQIFNLEKAPIKTGKVVEMQKFYSEGLANHTGPESCGSSGNAVAEALTGVRAGRVLSPVMKTKFRVLTSFKRTENNILWAVMARHIKTRRGRRPLACTETSCTGIGRPCIWPLSLRSVWRTLRG